MNLKALIEKLAETISDKIEIANVALLGDADNGLQSNSAIILSIVNLEEDKVLKNQTLYQPYVPGDTTINKKKNPTQNLSLSLLFSSYNNSQEKYLDGIDKLEEVIRFFQNNLVLYWDGTNLSDTEPMGSFDKVLIDMISLKLDQVNQLWSYLGAKYLPSVLYRLQFIPVQVEENQADGIVQKAKIQLWDNDKNDIAGELESATFTKNNNNETIKINN